MRPMHRSFQLPDRLFRLAAGGSISFVLLTIIAMFLFPGGTALDPHNHGYSFFMNPFSDLGQTQAGGVSNLPSMLLFISAMTIGAMTLSTFFVGVMCCVNGCARSKHLSRAGAVAGIVSGLCFAGVGFTPWDLYLHIHMIFVVWAFRLFLGAVVLNLLALMAMPEVPRRFAYIFAIFAVLLFSYILLLGFGPAFNTEWGIRVHVIGQKLIVYSAILTVLVQSITMHRHFRPKLQARAAE
jgi:hypothetical protein